MSIPVFECFEAHLHPSGVFEFVINRPRVYNVLNPLAYQEWLQALEWAATDERVRVFVMTGKGVYYCAGTELARPKVDNDRPRRNVTEQVVHALIDFPKLLVAAINGPAYGISVTTLGLFDIIYASPDATFTTPFMKLGFCAEGCSSYTFPRLMGFSRANEMLLLGQTISVDEMVQCGFVSRMFSKELLRDKVLALATDAAHFSPEALKVTRELIRGADRAFLHNVNTEEFRNLHQRVQSPESVAALNAFVGKSLEGKEIG
ncbi:ClpP/crotonase [Hesseltinella vesiculosa]|uniref:ClpP/crotonase n=1 Tax=Hesseltinella vesiculosa TaxID=101127 RepID=A0A1X2G2N2_9FUNG|nr:ClpP/crotonase [Hesseltinella vesiculosa]